MFTTGRGKYSVMFASWLNIVTLFKKNFKCLFFHTCVSKKDQMECTPEVDKVNSSIKCVALFYVYCPLTLICKRCDSGDERNYFFFPCLSISEIDELKEQWTITPVSYPHFTSKYFRISVKNSKTKSYLLKSIINSSLIYIKKIICSQKIIFQTKVLLTGI